MTKCEKFKRPDSTLLCSPWRPHGGYENAYQGRVLWMIQKSHWEPWPMQALIFVYTIIPILWLYKAKLNIWWTKRQKNLAFSSFSNDFPMITLVYFTSLTESGHRVFHVIDVATINTVEGVKNMPDSARNTDIKLHLHRERYFVSSSSLFWKHFVSYST